MSELQRLVIHNYRCLRDIDFAAKGINVLFGPNGVGKTTFLDALYFVRECALRGSADAASDRHHGIGLLTDNIQPGEERIDIGIGTHSADYVVTFGYSSGRIEPFVGERLVSKTRKLDLVTRSVGSDQATLFHEGLRQAHTIKLPDPERLALNNFMLYSEPESEALEINGLLKSLHFYSSRSVNLYQLRKLGSESGVHTYPFDRWQNLWSALRNLQGRRAVDDRYDTILGYMRRAFPDSFKDLVLESIGTERVGASVVEVGRRSPIQSSGVSDGHLQLLGLLTALFGDTRNRSSLLLFDEPETSLHPHAIAVFAAAVQEAASDWDRQVFVSTHSPVLLSQFEPRNVVLAATDENRFTRLRRVSEMSEVQDLLEHYAIGSLYMAEAVGRQGTATTAVMPGESDFGKSSQ
jgi:predicted ATPase